MFKLLSRLFIKYKPTPVAIIISREFKEKLDRGLDYTVLVDNTPVNLLSIKAYIMPTTANPCEIFYDWLTFDDRVRLLTRVNNEINSN
jgi:hypothetical protein